MFDCSVVGEMDKPVALRNYIGPILLMLRLIDIS